MNLNRKSLNEAGVAHLLLLVAVVVIVIVGVGTLVAVRHSKLQNDRQANTQATTDQQQMATANAPAQKAEEATAATTSPQQTSPAPQQQSAPKPATPKITHPTDANCPANGGTMIVYASVSGGTPVYKQNYADSQLVSHKATYGSSLTVSCYGGGWMEYREGDQPYYVNYSDVSVTKP